MRSSVKHIGDCVGALSSLDGARRYRLPEEEVGDRLIRGGGSNLTTITEEAIPQRMSPPLDEKKKYAPTVIGTAPSVVWRRGNLKERRS